MFASSCEGLNISLGETADVVFLHFMMGGDGY
jgi:hypothetical protein